MPGALVRFHGPFTWGASPGEAAANAAYLEEVARIALLTETLMLRKSKLLFTQNAPHELVDKHFLRKHGPGAYYGQ
jgi:L-ribulose-5-phosphate 4-epimerase